MVALDPKEQRKVPIFLKRSPGSTSSTSDDNCVSCGDAPKCPTCKDDEQCVMTTQTCDVCPKTYCTKLTSTLNSSKNSGLSGAKISGIAIGSLVFTVLLITGAGYLIYTKWWLKKHPDSTLFGMRLGYRNKEQDDQEPLDGDELGDDWGDKKQSKRMSQIRSSRSSVMTKASNVLNVAYIPGVKISAGRGRRIPHSTRAASVFSKDTLLSSIDEASVHAGQVASKGIHPQLIKVTQPEITTDGTASTERSLLGENSMKTNLQQEVIQEEEEEEEEEDKKAASIKLNKSSKPASIFTSGKVSDKINLDKTPFGALVLKKKSEPLASDSESDTDSDLLDSDTESIQKINEEFQRKKEEALSRSGTMKKRGLNIPVRIVPVGEAETVNEEEKKEGSGSNGIMLELDIDDSKADSAVNATDKDVAKKEKKADEETVEKSAGKDGEREEKTQKSPENGKNGLKSLDPFKTPFD